MTNTKTPLREQTAACAVLGGRDEKPPCPEIDLGRYAVSLMDVGEIRPSPENDEIYGEVNADNDPALPALTDSINKLGLEEPLIVTRDNYVLSGHRRLHAVKSLGWTHAPVRVTDVFRDGSPDYHRLLAAYNPQRVKSVAAVMAESFIRDEYITAADFLAREYRRKSTDDLDVMTVEGSKGINPIGPRQPEFLAAAVAAINEMRDFWPLTIRQVHYRLLNNPPLTQVTKKRNERWRYANNDDCYERLSSLLVSARYLGHVPMHAIDDPTRTSVVGDGFRTYANPQDFIASEVHNFLTGYRRDLLEGQPKHVEVLLEKNTLLNIAGPVCEKFMLPHSVNRGYGNPSLFRKMELRWREGDTSRPFVLLVVSDHDPEGFDLADDAVRSLRDLHGVPVELVRVGVTIEQVREIGAPPNWAKETSSRFASYVERTGTKETWECEALPPDYLQCVIQDAVLEVLDLDQLNAVVRRNNEELEQIAKIRRHIGAAIQNIIAEGAL